MFLDSRIRRSPQLISAIRPRAVFVFSLLATFIPQFSAFSPASRTTKPSRTVLEATSRRNWFGSIASGAAAIFLAAPPSQATAVIAAPPRLCDQAISELTLDGVTIRLVGTAHISDESALLVGDIIRTVRPETVFVELDAKRVGRFLEKDGSGKQGDRTLAPTPVEPTSSRGWGVVRDPVSAPQAGTSVAPAPSTEKLGIFSAIRTGLGKKIASLYRAAEAAAVGSALQSMYSQLDKIGFSSGEEFKMAIETGSEIGSKIVLGDRDVQVTLNRLSEALEIVDWNKLTTMTIDDSIMPKGMGQNSAASGDISKEDLSQVVEALKTRENVRSIMNSLKKELPELYTALVAERDEYMANGLDIIGKNGASRGMKNAVAVMGMAHLDGVERYLQSKGW
eukprot:CAMPEP_0113306814 /NCGR_PEP_ID=MMETSP0010_2-20120614/5912_1 /TAXON_ID=216773 ORGANISM="Corethron hystrix, Strain 308" /NCGR_SAMPLE_ID=MMETSP0010_2 /ASSEMBLY_ACC=CAM_ASM_000155 /LENGTH=393 /DNA_ID=CAMNT_0000161551 /DNA_START=223 /DNA_END=1401 /DNA_ORIENTATION=- /assembly_acc=CAM_ASM_000155